MKNSLMVLGDKLKLRKRGLIESVNDLLTSVFDVEHTRHRTGLLVRSLQRHCQRPERPCCVQFL
jgi:hypothetical protein